MFMTTKTIMIGVLALILGIVGGYVLAGTHQQPLPHTMSTTMDGMTATLAGAEGEVFEEAFIDEMIVHHQGAVAMAQMVLEKSQRPELVTLANAIISAQTQEIDLMRTWKVEWFGDVHHAP